MDPEVAAFSATRSTIKSVFVRVSGVFCLFAAGCFVSWAITAFYYRQSSVRTPEWAREFVLKLPDRPISQEEVSRPCLASCSSQIRFDYTLPR